MIVTWKKCGDDDHWCSLENLDLDSCGDVAGVYIIWHEGNPGRIVRVGQGNPIKERLGVHRNDDEVLAYANRGKLRVTWAYVSSNQRDGVERYLADRWKPLVGDVYPDSLPIAVNSPWQ
jgi:hypothetical protein